MDYPIWDIAIGGGVLMGIVAIAHVIVSHFAIGGGLVIVVTEALAVRRGDVEMRDLAKRSSLVLILVSTVFGAISGVGIWVVAGLISPTAISALIRNYVWGWAIEWVFFLVEIAAALVYYATWERISKAAHLMLGWIYFVAAYLSLVVINGIITFMLTPGQWLETGEFWHGFFNPTYFPSLLLRTGIAMMMAASFMLWPMLRASEDARPRLARFLGAWFVAGAVVAYGAYRWWEAALPATTRELFTTDVPTLVTLAETRHFLLWSLTAALLLAVVFLLLRPRWAKVVPVLLVGLLGFSFFGGYERLREGARKPFLIHDFMFSNGVRVDEVASLREAGMLSKSRWAATEIGGSSAATGRAVFRSQCASCHTLEGYLLVFTFVLHMLFMNLTSGGTILAAVARFSASGRRSDPRTVLAGRLMGINTFGISLTITTGIAPLLFVQVLYQQYFYTATILLSWIWLSLLVLLMLGYYAAYLFKFKGSPSVGPAGTGWLFVLALLFFLVAMVQVAVNLVHVQPGNWSDMAANPWLVLRDPTYVPRLAHFVLASIGMSGLVVAWWATRQARRGIDSELNAAIAAYGWNWALWTTVLQVVDGFLLLVLLPRDVLLGLMKAGPVALVPLTGAIVLGLGLLVMLARTSRPVARPRLVAGALVMLAAAMVIMSITRSQVRDLYLEAYTSQFELATAPQWWNFLLFALLLVGGLITLYVMVRKILSSQATGAEAA